MKNLGFGCMRLPVIDKNNQKSFDTEQIIKMIDTFIERGYTYFDTAYMYHDGESERILKKLLVERYDRDKFKLATKLPTSHIKREEDMPRIFNEQLQKTGVDFFDYYLIHALNANNYETFTALNGFEFLNDKKREGKIKKLGFSFHDTADVLDKILTEHPEIEFVQLQINYFDWDHPDIQSQRCNEVAVKHKKEIIVMEPIRGGQLANKVPQNAKMLFKSYDSGLSVASWAIRFAASCKNVIMVLSGMSTYEQLVDNTDYMENFIPLNDREKQLCLEAAKIMKLFPAVACTSCRYCVDGCPKNIAIPDYFKVYNDSLGQTNFEEKREEYIKISEKFGKVDDCIACKKCEEICPQHIQIVESLKKVAATFENN